MMTPEQAQALRDGRLELISTLSGGPQGRPGHRHLLVRTPEGALRVMDTQGGLHEPEAPTTRAGSVIVKPDPDSLPAA